MIPRPLPNSPIRTLERIWLYTSCAYNAFDETLMADEDWDLMAKELDERRREWTPYFRWSLPDKDYPVQTTSMGIDWRVGLARMFFQELAELDGDYSSVIAKFTPKET